MESAADGEPGAARSEDASRLRPARGPRERGVFVLCFAKRSPTTGGAERFDGAPHGRPATTAARWRA